MKKNFENQIQFQHKNIQSLLNISQQDQSNLTSLDLELLIQQYLSTKKQNKKLICPFWRRGICIFHQSLCQNAHGIQDLIYDDSQQLQESENNLKKNKKCIIDQQIRETYKCNKFIKEVITNKSYKILYDYQFVLLEQSKISKNSIIPLEQFNSQTNLRRFIKMQMHINNALEFMKILVDRLNGKYLAKQFVAYEFIKIGYKGKLKLLIINDLVFPLQLENSKNLKVILIMPSIQQITPIINQRIMSILQKQDQFPITAEWLCDQYYQQYQNNVEPSLYQFLKIQKLSLQEYLYQFFSNQNLSENILKEKKLNNIAELLILQDSDCINFNFYQQKNYHFSIFENNWMEKQLCLIKYDLQNKFQDIINYQKNCQNQPKQAYCHYWMRGICIFQKDQCFSAHGQYQLIFIQIIQNISFDDLLYKSWDGKTEIKNNQTPQKFKFKKQYESLFNYQKELIKNQLLHQQNIMTIDEIQNVVQKRRKLLALLHQNETRKVLNYIFENYVNIITTRSFIERELQRIGIYPKLLSLTHGILWYEAKVVLPPYLNKKIEAVFQMKSQHEYEKQIEIRLQNTLTHINQNNQELTIYNIQKYYYQNKNLPEVSLHLALKQWGLTLQQYLENLQRNHQFKDLLKNLKQYDSKEIIQMIQQKALETSQYFYISQSNILMNSVEHDQYIINSLRQIMQQTGFAISQLKTLLQETLLKENKYYLQFLQSEYILDFAQLIHQIIKNNIIQDISYNYYRSEKQIQLKQQRIIMVDSEEMLEYSQLMLLHENLVISVDLEGTLSDNGIINLIQMGICFNTSEQIQRQIFIFDIYSLKQNENSLGECIILLVKRILESTQITKIFFDCRQDIIALRSLLNISPRKVYDMAAIHVLYIQLQNISNIQQNQAQINKFPGLNDILQFYKAEFGINVLKNEMKARFRNFSQEYDNNCTLQTCKIQQYFYERPIDKEFLEYSVKDVEDLPQVFNESVQMTEGIISQIILKKFNNLEINKLQDISKQCTLQLFEQISNLYVNFRNLN